MAKVVNRLRERERERERLDHNKLIIWALYDDAYSSYKKAIAKYFNNLNLEVHSIGINNIKFPNSKKYFYHKIDLSLNNFNLINELKDLPKPDIILASPPCESWSGADCNGKMTMLIEPIPSQYNECKWVVKNSKFYDQYNKNAHPVKRRYFVQKERSRILGEATIGGTIEIIKYFNPSVWIIENPKTSKTWEFQKNHWNFDGILNDTYYSSYDSNFSLKPTIFKSNIKLNLKKEKINKPNKNHMALGNYSKRSMIPDLLIKDLISQVLEEIKK